MKKLLYLCLMLCIVPACAQQKDSIALTFELKVYGIYSVQFGDQALAKSHGPGIGAGLNASILSYGKLKLFGGLEMTRYHVTDEYMIGNASSSDATSYFGGITYDFPLGKKLVISPDVAYGATGLRLKSGDNRFSPQEGNEVRCGFFGNYLVSKTSGVILGIHYIHNSLEVKTAPEYSDFFNKAEQIQLSLGFYFD